jgi:hypothetical protein
LPIGEQLNATAGRGGIAGTPWQGREELRRADLRRQRLGVPGHVIFLVDIGSVPGT